ncbi:MAG: hypothetical protein IJB96_07810 [Lachnospira sp.]|nr:hypothetical protein [Lachnospira sp.]
MKEIGGMILKTTSVLVVLVGIVTAVAGMFFMQDSMFSTEYSMQTKLQTLFWLYVLCSGIALCVFGFYGAMNAQDYDVAANKRCIVFGVIAIVICVINAVVMAMSYNIFSILGGIIAGVPLLLAVLYLVSSLIKFFGKAEE